MFYIILFLFLLDSNAVALSAEGIESLGCMDLGPLFFCDGPLLFDPDCTRGMCSVEADCVIMTSVALDLVNVG